MDNNINNNGNNFNTNFDNSGSAPFCVYCGTAARPDDEFCSCCGKKLTLNSNIQSEYPENDFPEEPTQNMNPYHNQNMGSYNIPGRNQGTNYNMFNQNQATDSYNTPNQNYSSYQEQSYNTQYQSPSQFSDSAYSGSQALSGGYSQYGTGAAQRNNKLPFIIGGSLVGVIVIAAAGFFGYKYLHASNSNKSNVSSKESSGKAEKPAKIDSKDMTFSVEYGNYPESKFSEKNMRSIASDLGDYTEYSFKKYDTKDDMLIYKAYDDAKELSGVLIGIDGTKEWYFLSGFDDSSKNSFIENMDSFLSNNIIYSDNTLSSKESNALKAAGYTTEFVCDNLKLYMASDINQYDFDIDSDDSTIIEETKGGKTFFTTNDDSIPDKDKKLVISAFFVGEGGSAVAEASKESSTEALTTTQAPTPAETPATQPAPPPTPAPTAPPQTQIVTVPVPVPVYNYGDYYDYNDGAYYVFPESSSEYLDEAEVRAISSDQTLIRIAINEIYARHGRRFNDQGLQAYFDSMPWYSGTVAPDNFSDKVFNRYEKKNIELLSKYKK